MDVNPKKCSICQINPIKYTCPRCSKRTCSLVCCQLHKKTFTCNGQRDRTSFKSLHQMNDLDLLSDYRLLEEINRKIELSKRDEFGNRAKSLNEPTRYQRWMQTKLKALGSISLLYLPRFSTRHKQNQMWLDRRCDDVHWHIECRFFIDSTAADFYVWSIRRLPTRETTFSNLLVKFHADLCKKYSIIDGNLSDASSSNPEFLSMKAKNFFLSSPSSDDQLSVYIENFGPKRKQFGRFERRICSPTSTIVEIFRDRILIEFPIVFISWNNDALKMCENLQQSNKKNLVEH